MADLWSKCRAGCSILISKVDYCFGRPAITQRYHGIGGFLYCIKVLTLIECDQKWAKH